VRRIEVAPHHRERGFCCGAGGGRMWMEEKIGERINHRRVDQIVAAGEAQGAPPAAVASGCPFCLIMLDEGVGAKGIAEQLKPVDVLELVAARLTATDRPTLAGRAGRAEGAAAAGPAEPAGHAEQGGRPSA